MSKNEDPVERLKVFCAAMNARWLKMGGTAPKDCWTQLSTFADLAEAAGLNEEAALARIPWRITPDGMLYLHKAAKVNFSEDSEYLVAQVWCREGVFWFGRGQLSILIEREETSEKKELAGMSLQAILPEIGEPTEYRFDLSNRGDNLISVLHKLLESKPVVEYLQKIK